MLKHIYEQRSICVYRTFINVIQIGYSKRSSLDSSFRIEGLPKKIDEVIYIDWVVGYYVPLPSLNSAFQNQGFITTHSYRIIATYCIC